MPQPLRRLSPGAVPTLLVILLSNWLCIPYTAAAPIDEFRLSDIEQKIRDLESAVREQARVISQLQSQTPGGNRSGNAISPAAVTANGIADNNQRWLNVASWQRIKPGMTELQVIELLGAPTQMRLSDDKQTRTLLYALEIGRSGFLTGKVQLKSGQVMDVEIPSLK